jgi:hypothetical protein
MKGSTLWSGEAEIFSREDRTDSDAFLRLEQNKNNMPQA